MKNIIKSKDNSIVKYIAKLLSSASFRRKENQYFIEGIRLCEDAVISKVDIKEVFYTEEAHEKYKDYIDKILQLNVNSYIFSKEVFSKISDTKTPQGVACLCNMLDKHLDLDKINNKGKYIILENIQDPINLGTILRTAEALGINGIFISLNSCDIYSPKVLRGSMGAVFRLPIYFFNNIEEIINIFNFNDIKTYASVPLDNAKDISEINFKEGCAIAIGNEGNGLTKEAISLCSQSVTIPMSGKAESLNAAMACGIIMWEMMKRR